MLMQNEYLKFEIHRTLKFIKDFSLKLKSYEFYSESPNKFLDIIINFIETLQLILEDLPPRKFLYEYFLKTLNYEIIPLLRYIKSSQTKYIPWSIISNYDKIIHNLFEKNFIVIFRPQWKFNYSIITTDVSEYLESTLKRLSTPNQKYDFNPKEEIHVISFPVLEKTNFLFHSLIGHEIGHLYQKQYFQETFFPEYTKIYKKELVNRSKKSNKPLSPADKVLTSYASYAEEVMDIYQGMLREIIPDIIGYLLFGPSLLYSLYLYSFWMNDCDLPSKKNGFYPPLKYRIRLLHNLFKDDLKQLKNIKSKTYLSFKKFEIKLDKYLQDKSDLNLLQDNDKAKRSLKLFEAKEKHIYIL